MIGTVPPSALQAAPVTYEERSEQRNTITEAISSGASESSERPSRADLREHLVTIALLIRKTAVTEPCVRLGRPGRDGVAADAVLCVQVGDETRQRQDRGLRDRVVRHAGGRPLAGGRGDVDDDTAASSQTAVAPRGSRGRSS